MNIFFIISSSVLFLLLAAVSPDEPVSTEDRLRDHLRMFRHVFGGSEQYHVPVAEVSPTFPYVESSPQDTGQDAQPKIGVNIIQDNRDAISKKRRPHKHHQRRNMTHFEFLNSENSMINSKIADFTDGPASHDDIPGGSKKKTDDGSDSESTSGSDSDTETSNESDSTSGSESDSDTEHEVNGTTDELTADVDKDTKPSSKEKLITGNEPDIDIEHPEEDIDSSLGVGNESSPKDHGLLIGNAEEETNEENKRDNSGTVEEEEKEEEEEADENTKDDAAEEVKRTETEEAAYSGEENSDDEAPEDKRISELLVNGLKSLLINQTNNTAEFVLPELGLDRTTGPTYTEDPPSTTTNEPEDATSVGTPSSIALFVDDSGGRERAPNSDEDLPKVKNPTKGKKNLKSVIDLGRKMRKHSSGYSKSKTGSQRKSTYLDVSDFPTKGADTSTDDKDANEVPQPKKLHLKDLLDQNLNGFHDDVDNRIKSIEKKSKPEKETNYKETNESPSEIRKMYFDSLERNTDEDLLAYFYRIYPELQHLVGDSPKDGTRYEAPKSSLEHETEDIETDLNASPTSGPPENNAAVSPPKRVVKIHYGRPKKETETKNDHATSDFDLDLKRFRQFHDHIRERETKVSEPEHKTLLEKIGDSLSKFRSETSFFHNPFAHEFTSEATKSAEIYPSVVGAVILALFLILL